MPVARLSVLNSALLQRSAELHGSPQARARPRPPPHGVRRADGAHRRLGHRRGTRLREHPRGRHRRFALRARTSNADVQPAPRCVPRRGHRRRVTSAPVHSAGDGEPSRSTTARCAELATVGFEYGYDVQDRTGWCVWEARSGDFVDGAQIVIDRVRDLRPREVGARRRRSCSSCRTATRARGRSIRARGPNASCRVRPTSTCVCANCTTAAQSSTCSGARRLLLRTDPLPLIVLTPKSLCAIRPRSRLPPELEEGSFRSAVDDAEAAKRAKNVTRLVLCAAARSTSTCPSEHARAAARGGTGARVEQLYPFPSEELDAVLRVYPKLEDVVWLPGRARDMGAWDFVRPLIHSLGGRLRSTTSDAARGQSVGRVGVVPRRAPAGAHRGDVHTRSAGARRAAVRSELVEERPCRHGSWFPSR